MEVGLDIHYKGWLALFMQVIWDMEGKQGSKGYRFGHGQGKRPIVRPPSQAEVAAAMRAVIYPYIMTVKEWDDGDVEICNPATGLIYPSVFAAVVAYAAKHNLMLYCTRRGLCISGI